MDLKKIGNILGEENRIIGREKYTTASVMILIGRVKEKDYFILQKRAKDINQGGEISFPGGRVEKRDRNYLETAQRETEEEMNISREQVKVLGKLGTMVSPVGIIIEAFVGHIELSSFEEIHPNISEVEKVIYFPIEEAREQKPRLEMLTVETHPYYEKDGVIYKFPAEEMNLPEKYHRSWKSPGRKIYIYSFEGEIVWGITADIIYEMIKILNMEEE